MEALIVPVVLVAAVGFLLLPVVSLRVAYGLVTDASLSWGSAIVATIVASLADAVVGAGLSYLPPQFVVVGAFAHVGVWVLVLSSFCNLDLPRAFLVTLATWFATVLLGILLVVVVAAPAMLLTR